MVPFEDWLHSTASELGGARQGPNSAPSPTTAVIPSPLHGIVAIPSLLEFIAITQYVKNTWNRIICESPTLKEMTRQDQDTVLLNIFCNNSPKTDGFTESEIYMCVFVREYCMRVLNGVSIVLLFLFL